MKMGNRSWNSKSPSPHLRVSASPPLPISASPCLRFFPVAPLAAAVLLAAASGYARSETQEEVKAASISPPLVVDITGVEYEWHMRYPGLDGKLNTADDGHDKRHLHLPAHTEVKLQLHSEDYLYSFALPHVDLKEIAIPDLEFSLSFTTGSEGTFDLLGDQLCGYAHPKLMGKLIILSPRDFAGRMRQLGKTTDEA